MINVAITGTGFMGTVHTEALKRLPGVQVLGIHGSSPEKSQRAAERLELPKAYDRFEDLLADGEVDAVHITTPNRLHYPQTMAALDAGKHVLCEKPLAMSAQESAELVRKARDAKVATAVNYNIRFYPMNLEAKARVLAGETGPLHSITGTYQQDWLLFESDYNWRILSEEQGDLRAVADIGTHWIDLVQHIAGQQVAAVFADLQTIHPVRQRPAGEVETFAGRSGSDEPTQPVSVTTDDFGSLLFRFADGAKGSLFVSQVTPGRKNCLRYEISGSRGCVSWDSEDPNVLQVGFRDRPNETVSKDPSLNAELTQAYTAYPPGHAEGFPDTFKMKFKAFYASIAGGDFSSTSEFATFEDGHHEIVLCDAVLQSHREQRWVEVDSNPSSFATRQGTQNQANP